MSSGGGKAKTPTLLNDNLYHKQFYRVLDILSEGPIYGPVNQKAPLNDVMLNDTPVTDANGNTSIPGVSIAWRNGTVDQSPINGFNAIESTVIVNAKVTHDTPIIRTVSDPNVTRVRLNVGVDALVQSDDKGNQYNTFVVLVVDVKPSSSSMWSVVKDITIGPGKQSGEYLEAHIINAPNEKPFDIRVRRITADSNSDLLRNDTRWSSYSEIIDDNLSYPYTAVAGAVIDHDQYTDTPSRAYHLRGLIVDVPDNYNPETRTYSGLWLGGLKKAYTNNPAWLFRYLVKNERFGLARHAGYIDVDDGALYTLSQYCDQLVDDGYGGLEPRMTLNAYITEQMSARDLLDNIAGMFRGIALWDGQRLTVMIDAPQDPIATITNANVVDGAFTRSSIARAECYNAVIVSWTDPENGWEQSKEYVADDELIARDGYNETTLEAFGCTSRGQAYRAGKWLIETAKREPSKFTFKMARDAIHFTPGDIIEILDNNRAGARLGGRIVANNGRVITVDKVDSEYITPGDTISLLDSDGKFKKHQITGVSGNKITLASAPAWIRNGTVFAVSTNAAKPVLCRITSVAETENNSVYTVEASQHDPHKQAVVDNGAIFEVNNDTLNHFRVPNIENLKVLNIGSETVQCRATWETLTTTHRLTFEIRVYNAAGAVVKSYETTNYRYDFYGIDSGIYSLGIRGRNDTGMKGAESIVDLVIGAPAAPVGINWVPGVFQATVYPISKTTLTTDTSYEFYYSGEIQITNKASITTKAQYVGRGHQWTFGGMKTGHAYYVYVRTRNAFGVSDFIEASGKPTEDFDEITDYVTKDVLNSKQFKDLISDNEQFRTDVDNLKGATSDLINRVQKNDEDLGIHKSLIDEIGVELSEQDSELAQARARLQNVSIALLNNSVAQTTSGRTLSAQLKQSKAEITRIDEVVATEKEATAKALSKLETKINDKIKSTVTNFEQAITTLEQATAQQISEVTASINGQSVLIEENKTAITNINGNMSATWSIKIASDSRGVKYASGMSLGITGDGQNTQSQCIFLVDRFVLMTGENGSYQTPFYVTNGAMYVREAFIKDGSIDNAKIGNAITSYNWNGSDQGWAIHKNGWAYFNNVTVRGTVYANDGVFNGTVYATDGKFTGSLEAKTFIGDVANMYTGSDVSRKSDGTLQKVITYTDTSASAHGRHICVMANVNGNGACTVNINGSAKGLSVNDNERLIMHSAAVYGQSVTVVITISAQNGRGAYIFSPTVIVSRGSGSFSG
ncbi:TPA: phage tail protein [Escherichia coli]